MSYDNYETLKVTELEPKILEISLNIPDKLNSMNVQMIKDLEDLTDQLKKDTSYSVVLLTGEGQKAFCAGLDVKGVFNPETVASVDKFYASQISLGNIMLNLRQMPQIVVCAAFGYCVGGGFIMPMASDIRVIADNVQFSAPFVKIKMGGGDLGTSYFLWREVGSGVAADLLLTGRTMYAEEAMRLGFASECVAAEELHDTALAKCKELAETDKSILRLTKEILNINMDMGGLENAMYTEHRNQQMIISKLWRGGDPD